MCVESVEVGDDPYVWLEAVDGEQAAGLGGAAQRGHAGTVVG